MSDTEKQTSGPAKTANKYSTPKRIVFTIVAALIFLTLAVIADRVAGVVSPAPADSLLFPGGSSVRHESNEFDVTVRISHAGIRDDDYDPGTPPAGTRRIVAIGDSFTFGWGVEAEDAWPNVVERTLAETFPCEILNFGFPGSSPYDYEGTARKALQHFRPHMLIIGTLQGDDLIQLHEGQRQEKPLGKIVAQTLFPTFTRFIRGKTAQEPMQSYREMFLLSSQYARNQFGLVERDRYAEVSADARTAFEAGLLNPSLVRRAVTVPNHFSLPCDDNPAWKKKVTAALRDSLERTQALCRSFNCKLIVAIIPDGPYVSAAAGQGMQNIGYAVIPDLLQTTDPDTIVAGVCTELAIPCLVQTDEFREESKSIDYYFPMDGHFNLQGHKAFASRLSDFVRQHMDEPAE